MQELEFLNTFYGFHSGVLPLGKSLDGVVETQMSVIRSVLMNGQPIEGATVYLESIDQRHRLADLLKTYSSGSGNGNVCIFSQITPKDRKIYWVVDRAEKVTHFVLSESGDPMFIKKKLCRYYFGKQVKRGESYFWQPRYRVMNTIEFLWSHDIAGVESAEKPLLSTLLSLSGYSGKVKTTLSQLIGLIKKDKKTLKSHLKKLNDSGVISSRMSNSGGNELVRKLEIKIRKINCYPGSNRDNLLDLMPEHIKDIRLFNIC